MNNTYSVHLTVHRLNFLNGCSRKQSGDRRYGIAKCDTFPITKRKKPIPNNKGFGESFGVKFGETLVKMRVKTWVKILQLLKERPDLSLTELAVTFGKSLSANGTPQRQACREARPVARSQAGFVRMASEKGGLSSIKWLIIGQ